MSKIKNDSETRKGDSGTVKSARQVLSGKSKKGWLARLMPFMGPAFIASVAYMDPGNFATNIQGGAKFGLELLWVIVASNLMAMLLQTLSAKLGIASGSNLAEHCRDNYPKWVVWGMWTLPSWWRLPPTWPSSWGRRWVSTCCSGCRCSGRAF